MFGTYFYNESMRRMTIGFGQIFNNILIKRRDSAGNITQSIKVPVLHKVFDSTSDKSNMTLVLIVYIGSILILQYPQSFNFVHNYN